MSQLLHCDVLDIVSGTPVDIVAHKEIVSVWYFSSETKKFHEIVELAMYVSTDYDRSSYKLNIGLCQKNLFSLRNRELTFSQRALTSTYGSGLH